MAYEALMQQIDHLVFAVPNLEEGMDYIQSLLGVRPISGGSHPGWGSHNALLSLGPGHYLEVIAPDPNQPRPLRGHAFGLDRIQSPRLVRWAAKSQNLHVFQSQVQRHGISLGDVLDGQRSRADGTIVQWQLTDPWIDPADGIVPFFIDWGNSIHPSADVTSSVRLIRFRAEHPQAKKVERRLRALAVQLEVTVGKTPRLIADIVGPHGRVELQ